MNNTQLKNAINGNATSHGFENKSGVWVKQSEDSIVIIELQKSNFGNQYDIIIKIFLKSILGLSNDSLLKFLKKHTGHIFKRQPPEYNELLDINNGLEDKERLDKLTFFFNDFVAMISNNALSISGIKNLAKRGEIFLLPAIKKELQV